MRGIVRKDGMTMYSVMYHSNCFYWFVADDHGNEVYWAMSKEACEEWVRDHS